ncbi:unnamed protein product [Echinostoma caproni]|uniref:Doublecortin domain-containing protein n=1 Tax=Echinostoma caproni TaxID=27848 RepID=A0A183B464_9TREM|nr:unnamed protein product [Echinostoma caproni]
MNRANPPDLLTLSPSRSIDSQLAQLNQSLHKTHLSDVPFSPRSKCPVLNSDQLLPTSLSGTYSTSFSSTSSGASRVQDAFTTYSNSGSSGVTRSRGSADDRGSNGSGGVGRWQLGRLRDVFMAPKRPQTQITPEGHSLSQRLRKTRHLNNVVLARRGLTAGEVFDKISNALNQESIRFTLKGVLDY